MSKRKSRFKTRKQQFIAAAVAIFILLAALITANGALQLPFLPTWDSLFTSFGLRGTPLPDSQLRMTVLDVGNADCILLENKGEYMLIDAGENSDGKAVVQALNYRGITKLKYVIATHADSDHIGGMDDVVNAFPIETFMMSFMPEEYTPTTVTYEKLLTALVERDVEVTEPKHGDTFTFGDATIEILSGLSDHDTTNEQSIVCAIRFGNNRFLMMGDAGKEVEEELLAAGVNLRADVLKVGHHGSRHSSTEAFIEAVSPDYAVITCGLNNSYGHPHRETVEVLEEIRANVYRCDLHGEIVLVSDGKTVTVTTEK